MAEHSQQTKFNVIQAHHVTVPESTGTGIIIHAIITWQYLQALFQLRHGGKLLPVLSCQVVVVGGAHKDDGDNNEEFELEDDGKVNLNGNDGDVVL